MHNTMFASVLRAPLDFFTATPIGRVLGSFSKDMDNVDESLQDTIHMCTIYLMILGTTSGVVLSVVPYFAAILGALIFPSVFIFLRYLGASGSLKRRVGTADAALNAHVSESQQGIAVIRAYGAEERFMRDNAERLLVSQRCTSNLETLQVWLAFRLDLFGCLLVLVTCLLSVGLWESLSASRAGLAISNSFQILLFFSLMVRGLADINAGISAVDRIKTLGDVKPEPDVPLTHESCPSEKWPQHGEVEFHNVVMSYAPSTPQV